MSEEIINRVAKSKLITLDLEDYYPEGKRRALDIKDWLFEGLILREKPFREALKNYNWEDFKNQYVAIYCSTDAIVPGWAYMLIQTHLNGIAKKTVFGSLDTLETVLYSSIIEKIDLEFCKDSTPPEERVYSRPSNLSLTVNTCFKKLNHLARAHFCQTRRGKAYTRDEKSALGGVT